MFESKLRQRLADLEMSVNLSQRIRAILLEGLCSGRATIEHVVRKLMMRKRMLQRRLDAEGSTRYQAILNDTRKDLVQYHLQQTVLSIAEITVMLGFDRTNFFCRAFRTWTGTTPDTIRRATRLA